MVGLVVICHGEMGTELVKAAEMIVGKIQAVEAVSVRQESAPETLRDEIQRAIKKVDRKNGVMVLTDMFGGTPSNIALAFLDDHVEVVHTRHRKIKGIKDLHLTAKRAGIPEHVANRNQMMFVFTGILEYLNTQEGGTKNDC